MVSISGISNKTTNYYYAGDYVYRSAATGSPDTLEFISHPEGRLRPIRIDTTQPISIANLKYIYDYFLKDHLGSVRNVLTTEQQIDFYAATMETAAATKENALFSNVSSTAFQKLSGFSNDNNNQKASKLNGDVKISTNKRVGPSIVLKVMTGDTISVSSWSWYQGPAQAPATGVADIATELLPLLSSGVAGVGGGKGGAIPSTTSDPLLNAAISAFHPPSRAFDNTRPKAFLNWMVVGEDFAGVSSPNHMNAIQIPVCNAGDTLKQTVGLNNLVVRRNGYIYIYLSNESAQDVYFDNLVINLKHGPLVEIKNYYAFGMENPALSSKAIKSNYNENRYKYNGIEYDTAFGLNEYEAFYRDLDPIIGRWTTLDPKIEENQESISPYSSMSDNPERYADPLGDCLPCLLEELEEAAPELEETGNELANTIGAGINITLAWLGTQTDNIKAGLDNLAQSGAGNNESYPATFDLFIKSGAYNQTQTSIVQSNSAPPPNNGDAKKHGSANHNNAIDNHINDLKKDKDATNIRKNQQQVDVNGKKTGKNRPDVQHDKGGKHHAHEFDHKKKSSKSHAETIKKNDPKTEVQTTILIFNNDD